MGSLPFPDRAEAGRQLGEHLRGLDLDRPLVLGVPRGGVPVAAEVSNALGGDLDVVVVRKVGAPHNPELGLGAVGPDGDPVLDDRLLHSLRVTDAYLAEEVEAQRREARRRLELFRGRGEPADVSGRDVVVVDDGIATGGTVIAAGGLLRSRGPRRVLLAVPVAPAEGVERVRGAFDDVVCLATPEPYMAVGQWYVDFHQVSDEEVRSFLSAESA